ASATPSRLPTATAVRYGPRWRQCSASKSWRGSSCGTAATRSLARSSSTSASGREDVLATDRDERPVSPRQRQGAALEPGAALLEERLRWCRLALSHGADGLREVLRARGVVRARGPERGREGLQTRRRRRTRLLDRGPADDERVEDDRELLVVRRPVDDRVLRRRGLQHDMEREVLLVPDRDHRLRPPLLDRGQLRGRRSSEGEGRDPGGEDGELGHRGQS